MNNPSKLQSKAVKGLMKLKETLIYDEEVSDEDAERDAENQLKQFLSDQIQKAVDEGYQLGFSNGMKSVASALGYKSLSIQSKGK